MHPENRDEPDLLPDLESGRFAIIGDYRSARRAHEAGLSVLAFGQPYWLRKTEGRYLLIVPAEHEDRLRREVEIAAIRNRYWPPPSLDLPLRTTSVLPTGLFVVMIAVVFALQHLHPGLRDFGSNSSEAVLQQSEWWRIVTAVTLHNNLGHLVGNILGIALFAHLCSRYMGNGLAWLLILLAASLSNLTNDFLNAGEHYVSLGASTAVFAALGLLTGFPIGTYLRSREPIQTRDWLIPFSGGCILFAWMGGGDFPTDVAGHLWSFVFGMIFSIAIGLTALHGKLKKDHQRILIILTTATFGVSWTAVWIASSGL